ncbi:MAG: hypothetical protein ACYCW6_26395, partial [Candidatus Xenobia bacterium]
FEVLQFAVTHSTGLKALANRLTLLSSWVGADNATIIALGFPTEPNPSSEEADYLELWTAEQHAVFLDVKTASLPLCAGRNIQPAGDIESSSSTTEPRKEKKRHGRKSRKTLTEESSLEEGLVVQFPHEADDLSVDSNEPSTTSVGKGAHPKED